MKITKLIQEHLDQGMHYYKHDDILITEANNEARIECRNNPLSDSITSHLKELGYDVIKDWRPILMVSKNNESFEDLNNTIQIAVGNEFIEEYSLEELPFTKDNYFLSMYDGSYSLDGFVLKNYKTYALQTNGSIIGENQTLDIVPFWNEKDMKDYALKLKEAHEDIMNRRIKEEKIIHKNNFIKKHKQIMILKESEIEGFSYLFKPYERYSSVINVNGQPLIKKYLEDNFVEVSDDMQVILDSEG